MRKPNRAAAIVLAAVVAFPVMNVLVGPASAQTNPNEDRTDSEVYTEARADYWQARADYYARKAATQARKEAGVSVEADVPSGAPAVTPRSEAPAVPAPAPRQDLYPTDAQLAALRMCESTDRYWLSTGNGYYGAYQFSAVTWWWLGYYGYPHEAAPAVQDQAVRDLYNIFGWTPWPACSRYLGFR